MIFDNVQLFDFRKCFDASKPFYAHLKTDNGLKNIETLEEHMALTVNYLKKLWEAKNLETVYLHLENRLVGSLSKTAILLWRELFYNTIYTHDLGKTNPNFQAIKMKNNKHEKTGSNNTQHSVFSAFIYGGHYLEKVLQFEGKDQEILYFSLIFNSFIISRHHGYLAGFQKFTEEISKLLFERSNEHVRYYQQEFSDAAGNENDICDYFEKVLSELKNEALWESIPWYIYGRFLFGLLVSCDFYATNDFMDKPVDDFGVIKNVELYQAAYEKTELSRTIRAYKVNRPIDNNLDINSLRSELFLEAEEQLQKNTGATMFFLEAPTGSGKTNTSINLALKLLESDPNLNKISYVFPLNTLVEQTRESLEKAFKQDADILQGITVVNGVTPIRKIKNDQYEGEWDLKSEDDQTDYKKSLLYRQFLHYPIVLTTHVNFFNILFGNDREAVFPLAHLANSVVILDEIQSYRNDRWKEITLFLQEYGRLLNIKMIIMSATLPDLQKLSANCELEIPRLIKNPGTYYQNPMFKNRVITDFSLLEIPKVEVLEQLKEKIIEITLKLDIDKADGNGFKNKLVVEFIKKSTALDFFNQLKDELEDKGIDRKVLCMTGDDNKAERRKIIQQVNEGSNLVLIGTQVIEAGVDIDMDMGFKDISLFDAEEQFLGRINRSCLKNGSKVYFFDYDDASTLYKKDFRKQEQLTVKNTEMQKSLIEKDFSSFYDKVIKEMIDAKNSYTEANIEDFSRNKIWEFDYSEIKNYMALIEENYREISVYIYQDLLDNKGDLLDGRKIWDDYAALMIDSEMDYAQKRIRLSEVYEKMDYFIYQIPEFVFDYEDRIGDLFLCPKKDEFFPNGKFDRYKFKNFKANNLFV
jgi:CRISPR-associated endonuclease/helicase Cas3